MFKVTGGIKKLAPETEIAKRNITPLDYISWLTDKKRKWETFDEIEQKQFAPFIILKWLSMSQDLTPYISLIIKYTIGVLDAQQIYMFLYHLLPKQKFYYNYVKKTKSEKYNKELMDIFVNEYQISRREVADYLDFYKSNKEHIRKVVSKYGLTEKEVDKLLKEIK
jgi:hypothetical protein